MPEQELQKMMECHRAKVQISELSRQNNEPVYTQKEIDDKIENVFCILKEATTTKKPRK